MTEPLAQDLRLPVVCAPMFIVSGVELALAQCRAGVVGSFPALNARPADELPRWLDRMEAGLAEEPGAAPYAVNLVAHGSNSRFEQDAQVCVDHRVPLLLTSLHPPGDLVQAAHAYGGRVFHDVTTVRHAEKAAEQGVDGLVLVCAGAGGHTGLLSPFAFLPEVRKFFSGTIVLAGAITTGHAVAAARTLGADLAYLGTRFIATTEANAVPRYKEMIVESGAAEIVHTSYFSGLGANYLERSITASGIDIEQVRAAGTRGTGYRSGGRHEVKAWRDVWGAGQGVGSIDGVADTADVVAVLAAEYEQALAASRPVAEVHRAG
ncbi:MULTISPECIES: NAD(P)H-dependent flavin oxidoreductase [Pseudonocardia]|uniref:Nitronate monooxygenase n=2 Tax=Pseudonocardia TaxID=1847 RepID=A0A1Y2MLH0_PSEAH|nr:MULTISPECIES: nitronate monooxygenase family protein [Pseudonocardia]OSY35829.1 Nitronate monooxygenase [Pseudonocardia autotrophica]TDN73123.1 nitronate monooxygenase [Pseudonocardia autotrophica]BBG03842.1 hypothetical protein Pdca_50510 [Pseudonocardia autotrophica]GEC27359.1 hypothetical protein PSA01_43880 [Pseudonocardia saturnea]